MSLVAALLKEHKNDLSEVTVKPSSGGVFEIAINDELLFSKKELGRFPNEDEAEALIREKL